MASKKLNMSVFSIPDFKKAVKHLVQESYFQVGDKLLVQTIGISMGIDPDSFWANLYLYRHEYNFVKDLISENIDRTRKFHGCARFIDDMLCLNDGGEFGRSHVEIYPSDLELKCEHNGLRATFLDLDIQIKDNIFCYKLFDKRDAFPFFVVRISDRGSNIPSYIFYGTVLSEYLRIARATLQFDDFVPKIIELYSRMTKQGGDPYKIFRQFRKATLHHPEAFSSFNPTPEAVVNDIKQQINLRSGGT